jgi:dTDP-4-amino-4,6-dideoxy-D-galactose acyltransferase
MSSFPSCQLLSWDSEFFRKRIARLTEDKLDARTMTSALAWCADHRIDCLYYLCDPGDAESIHLAEAHGFLLVDVRLTLEAETLSASARGDSVAAGCVRPAIPDDIPALRDIARISHEGSRFYFDLHFDRRSCSEFYALWLEKSCKGWADVVLAACIAGRPAGYISCHKEPCARGRIGLLGVAPDARGYGLGSLLVRNALQWFSAQDICCVSVVTQGRNVKAQRLYQRYGFVTSAVGIWFHRWAPFVTGESHHDRANHSF